MKRPLFVYSGRSRLAAVVLAAALAGCATASATLPQKQKSESANASPPLPGTQTISGDDLRNNGRTDNAEALRALSPIFH
jgi:hypothetical protein